MNNKQKLYDKLSKLLVETPNQFKQEEARKFCNKHGLDWKRVRREVNSLKITKQLTRRLPQLPFE